MYTRSAKKLREYITCCRFLSFFLCIFVFAYLRWNQFTYIKRVFFILWHPKPLDSLLILIIYKEIIIIPVHFAHSIHFTYHCQSSFVHFLPLGILPCYCKNVKNVKLWIHKLEQKVQCWPPSHLKNNFPEKINNAESN